MKQNNSLLIRSIPSIYLWNFFFQKSKSQFIGLLVVLFTFLGTTNNLYSQITQRGIATTATSTTTSITITKPTGVVAGDILLVNLSSRDAINNNNLSDPSSTGWTLIQGSQITQNRRWGAVLYKIATGSEPVNYTFTLDADTNATAGAIVAFSGVDNTSPFDVATPAYLTANAPTTVTATGLTTATPNTAIIMFGVASSNPNWSGWTTTSPGALTELYDVNMANVTAGAAWAIKATTGATGDGTATLTSGQRNGAILVALRPLVTAPTNDICSGAINLTSSTTCTTTTGSTLAGTDNNETGDCTAGTEEAVWYSFVAVASSHIITVDGGAGIDPVLGVISTCGSTTTPTGGACIDATGDGGIETRTLTGLTIGNTYYIQVYDFFGVNMSNAFTICVTHTVPPTITSLTTPSGCVGSSLVINGTNLTGATAVTIGGTAATITATTATTVTVTVGSGTTGTVQVTTLGGSATSATIFTVNPNPTISTQPTATSICTTGSGSFSVIAAPATTYQWRRNGVNLTNIAPYSGVNTSTLSITNPALAEAGNFDVVISNGTCSITSATRALTVTTVPTTVTTPTPANSVTGVCYAGGGAVTSISWGAAAGATSYDVYFGSGSVPGTLTANVATNTYTTGALAANTTYYWRIVAKNSCGDAVTSSTFTFTTATIPCTLTYCTPTHTASCTTPITNVTLTTINNTTGCANTNGTSYTNYALGGSPTTSLLIGSSYTLSVSTSASAIVSVWMDLNGNGVFQASEWSQVYTTGNNGTISGVIPGTATPGLTTMRIRSRNSGNTNGSGDPCTSFGSGETEDYAITLVTPPPCTTPTAQPTAFLLTPSGSSIGGAFATAVPAADSYLVVMNTTNIAPSPINGTTYTVGGTIGSGNTVLSISNNTTFVATGLAPSTTYYFFVFAQNSLCTGGPIYNTTSPLNGTATTTTADPVYCTPSVGSGFENLTYFTNISFVGTLNDISNNSTYSSSPRGYQNFSSIASRSRQAQGQGINIATQTTNRGYLKAWVDWNKDGDFADAGEKVYDVGGIASYSTTFGFVIPTAQPVGNYTIRIRINKDDNVWPIDPNAISTFDECQNINYNGETEDYTFTVIASCSAVISSVTDNENCGTGAVVLSATGAGAPTEYRWYTTEFGGTPIATTATGTWTTPVLSATTTYWVTAYNGCESLVRTKVTATISPLATISFTPSIPEVCGENNVLSLTATGDKQLTYLVNESFTSGLGVMSNTNIVSNGAATDAITEWQNETSTFVPAQQVWFPAIASGMTGNNFAMSTSDVGAVTTHNAIVSPVVNTNTYLDLTVSFDIYYSRYYIDGSNLTLDYVTFDVSTDGGTTWTEIDRYTADIGYGTRFVNKTYNLNAYINQPNFRTRIRYYGVWCDGLAIDNFKLFGYVPLSTSFDWTSITPVAAYLDLACTTPYVTGTPITTVYIRPTLAQLEDTIYSFTATATLSNGCNVSQNVSINNKSKVWKGGTSNDWNNPNNWLPVGVPDATSCVIIPAALNTSNIIGTNYNAFGKTLQVKDGGTLIAHPSNTLTITDYVEVSPAGLNPAGIFNIENAASLIQINDVANTGTISMKRNVNIRKLDYVYWSSPVANFQLSNVSPGTGAGYRYKWTPTIGANTNGFGNWAGANEAMVAGKGYIVRGPDSFTATLANFTANFTGVPANGNITMPISRGTYDGANYATGVSTTPATKDDDNWNLIGNPYPSALNANDFLALNTNINGFIKLWSHGTLPSAITIDPFYSNYGQNYSVADYVTYNFLGPITPGFDGNIAAGQGFFVLMNHSSGAPTENVTFNNAMRSNAYTNNLFFRNASTTAVPEEKSRIWLDLVSPTNTASRMLVGYATNATNGLDRLYDAPALGVKSNFELYSLENTNQLSIQGRSLPFDNNDQVPLGVSIPQNGIYTIAIASTDGIFQVTSQNIYLEDISLGIIHDLHTAPYSFTATTGTHENRFILRYTTTTLDNEDFENSNAVTVFTDSNINVQSTSENIKSVQVFDVLGREIANYSSINSTSFTTENLNHTQNALFVKVTLENNFTKTYKVIY